MPKQQQLPLYSICSIDPARGLFISRLEVYIHRNADLLFPHQHDFYQVVFFTGGSGKFTIDFETFPVNNNIYFMVPGQVHDRNFNPDVKGFIMHFTSFFIESLVRKGYLEQFPFLSGYVEDQVINPLYPGDITLQMEELLKEPGTGDLANVLLLRLLLSVNKEVIKPGSKVRMKHGLVLQRFKALVNDTARNHRLPAEYARDLSVSPDYLNTVCRKETGVTAGKIIRDRVIVEAKRLMINGKVTMTEIAHQLGFPDNSYFTKFFRKYTGSTPDKFRNNIRAFSGAMTGDR